jgi:hypothetical protein
MKLRHPLTGDIYTRRDPDTIEVETTDGRSGFFTRKGVWIRGALREADPHMTGIVCAPEARPQSFAGRSSGGSRGVPVPTLGTGPSGRERSEEMDLGLNGKKVLITSTCRRRMSSSPSSKTRRRISAVSTSS